MVYTCFASALVWILGATTLLAQNAMVQPGTHLTTATAEIGTTKTAPAPDNMFLALDSGDMGFFRARLAAGANPNARDPKSGRTLLMAADKAALAQLLLTHGADPTLKDHSGATALHYAVHASEALDIIPQLIDKGADVNARATGGAHETPFMAARQLFFQQKSTLGTKVMRLLAQKGADINAADENGHTVLINAVVNDKPELVGLMIELGADVTQESNDGLTAQAWALELGFVDIIEMLEAAQQ